METQTQKGHPKGLYYLFFTEMWERFGYYLMLGIFALFMLDSANNGGMGFDAAKKSDIYGTYIGLVYLSPFIGGLLADRILGYRKSIVIGGILMAAGYICLGLPNGIMFYPALLLIILGNGFFKPNISTLVGNLYNDEPYKKNKDAGFNIFYMGINIGAFVCNFVAAYMRINYGWGYAFYAAGVGMLVGVLIFILGTKHIKHADVIKPVQPGDMPMSKILLSVIVPMFVFGALGWMIPGNLFGTDANDAFLIGCLPVIGFFIYLMMKANDEDKRPIKALLSVYACIIVFWAVFHQNGDALTVWAEDHTDREMPAAVATVAEKVNMAQVVTNAGAATDEKSAKYFSNLPNKPAEGQSLKLFSAELYQSINPFWVVLLTPVVVGFFGWMRKRGKEPNTAMKIALGLLITALSAFVMFAAVKATNMETDKASSWWLIMAYGVITVGELCLSPMGLSLVSKLSPPRITALMMGGFFLSTAVGNKLAGILSGLWEGFEDKSNFFLMNFALVFIAFLAMFMLVKWLSVIMKEKGVN
ncbi:MAG: peptide MFS transporter [Chitinophagaceae bacterium]